MKQIQLKISTSIGAGISFVASTVAVASAWSTEAEAALAEASAPDALATEGSLVTVDAVPAAGVGGAAPATGAAASTCFRFALTAANRAASLNWRMTFKMRKKKAWLEVLLVSEPIEGNCSS